MFVQLCHALKAALIAVFCTDDETLEDVLQMQYVNAVLFHLDPSMLKRAFFRAGSIRAPLSINI